MLRCKVGLAYRRPMAVFGFTRHGGCTYPVCPRCQRSLDREYMAYCDRCGQRLRWERYEQLMGRFPALFQSARQ